MKVYCSSLLASTNKTKQTETNKAHLIVRATGEEISFFVHRHFTNPFVVTQESLDTISSRRFPDANRFVSRASDDVVAVGRENNARDVVIVAV